ncbi:PE family protein [Mycobacterium uberis]|nr:PE family protein [Mycobacterium uberis]
MSFDPALATIGSQVLDTAAQGIQFCQNVSAGLTVLAPAGADEVSLCAVEFFAEEANQMLAMNQAAHEELMRAGVTLAEIARMYSEADAAASKAIRASELAGF